MKAVKEGATMLSSEELKKFQQLHNDFAKAKIAIADLELQKQSILGSIGMIKSQFADLEHTFVEQYGPDAVINIQTGEITYKSKQNDSL